MCAAGTRVATPFGRDLCFLKLGEATRDAPHVMVYGNERADDTARSSFNRSADLAASTRELSRFDKITRTIKNIRTERCERILSRSHLMRQSKASEPQFDLKRRSLRVTGAHFYFNSEISLTIWSAASGAVVDEARCY